MPEPQLCLFKTHLDNTGSLNQISVLGVCVCVCVTPLGFLPATSGTVYINGHDVQTSLEKVCGSLGLCPQDNILYDDFTVDEQLYFFGRVSVCAYGGSN